ncbi:putative integral membrane protein [Lipingzhangella halophila]|uniref:Putative integral membrane protein n=1 Tax=Lipingzhangella halophila TaxID=1783352 RepID=A0A7W7RNZ1_9ACTN|nr:hypothetical protein [Lipingzhangella halophila]MBB4935522.1 putative integral membrane protein [Lipingzhangella halophila]
MGRILLIIAVAVAVIIVAGALFSLLMGLLKWGLILGAILLGVVGVSKLVKSRSGRR